MAGTLEALGEELVAQASRPNAACGKVLRRLRRADLQQARLACKLFDAASRRQDVGEAGTRMKLYPGNVSDRPRPDWARLPRVRRLELDGFSEDGDIEALQSFISPEHPPAPGAPITELRITDGVVDHALLAHLLLSLPGLESLRVPAAHRTRSSSADTTATLAVVATLAPALTHLHLNGPFDVKNACLLSRGLPGLRSFGVEDGESEDIAGAVLAALPPSLTSLRLGGCNPSLFPHWPQLLELRCIQLSATAARTAAVAMPNLRLLVAELLDDWADARPAPFANVTKASLDLTCCDNLHVARLLPALEQLHFFHEHLPDTGTGAYTLGSLPGLTCLECVNTFESEAGDLSSLGDVAAARGLRMLTCSSPLADLPRLLAPLTSLKTLTLHVYDDGSGGPFELGAILAALTRLTSLRTMQLYAPGARVGLAALARFSRALPQLFRLHICEPELQPHDVAMLAAHPGLRHLACALRPAAPRGRSSQRGQAEATIGELEHALRERGLNFYGSAGRGLVFKLAWTK